MAGPIFRDFMREALKNEPDIPFRVPEGVQLVRVNATTGKPATSEDKNVITEAFRVGTSFDKEQKIIGDDITIYDDENTPDIGGLY